MERLASQRTDLTSLSLRILTDREKTCLNCERSPLKQNWMGSIQSFKKGQQMIRKSLEDTGTNMSNDELSDYDGAKF